MMEFGQTLRAAREAKGLSVSQVAETTHILTIIIEGLERDDFSKISAAIYGRGFVKLYCEAVGLDPKPMIAEFMEIFSGKRVPGIRERAPLSSHASPQVPPAAAAVPPAPPARPIQERAAPSICGVEGVSAPRRRSVAPPTPDLDELFQAAEPVETLPQQQNFAEFDLPPEETPRLVSRQGATRTTLNIPQQAVRSPQPLKGGNVPLAGMPPRANLRQGLSRPGTTLKDRKSLTVNLPTINLPPNLWRILLVAVLCGLLLWGLFAGIRMLYRVTTDRTPIHEPTPVTYAQPVATPTPKTQAWPASPLRKANAPSGRTPQKIPSLYID